MYLYITSGDHPRSLKAYAFDYFAFPSGVWVPWRHTNQNRNRFSFWETAWGQRYDRFWVPFSSTCYQLCIFSLMKFSYFGTQAISGTDFWSLIIGMWVINLNLCIPPTDGWKKQIELVGNWSWIRFNVDFYFIAYTTRKQLDLTVL